MSFEFWGIEQNIEIFSLLVLWIKTQHTHTHTYQFLMAYSQFRSIYSMDILSDNLFNFFFGNLIYNQLYHRFFCAVV